MSSAKAALERDTRVLAFEAGRRHKTIVNTVSVGPLGSRASKGIGFIDRRIDHSFPLAPLHKMSAAGHSQLSHKCRQIVCCVKSEDSDGNLNGEDTILDEQNLERELQIAVEEENYAQAANIRDSLRFLQEDSKAAVLAANARFYNCFREGDLAAMRALWAKRDSICCVHPGVGGISGYDYVMGSWDYVCAEYDFPLEIEVKDVELFVKGDIGYVTCTETVKTKGTSNWGKQFATNVFERINGHWFICIHHASFVEL